MQYHAPTNQFTISAEELQRGATMLLYAIRKIRTATGLELKGYKEDLHFDHAEAAERGILDAACKLGINLGADQPGKLDLSDAG